LLWVAALEVMVKHDHAAEMLLHQVVIQLAILFIGYGLEGVLTIAFEDENLSRS